LAAAHAAPAADAVVTWWLLAGRTHRYSGTVPFRRTLTEPPAVPSSAYVLSRDATAAAVATTAVSRYVAE